VLQERCSRGWGPRTHSGRRTVITATHRTCRDGRRRKVREDLWYRLNVVVIRCRRYGSGATTSGTGAVFVARYARSWRCGHGAAGGAQVPRRAVLAGQRAPARKHGEAGAAARARLSDHRGTGRTALDTGSAAGAATEVGGQTWRRCVTSPGGRAAPAWSGAVVAVLGVVERELLARRRPPRPATSRRWRSSSAVAPDGARKTQALRSAVAEGGRRDNTAGWAKSRTPGTSTGRPAVSLSSTWSRPHRRLRARRRRWPSP